MYITRSPFFENAFLSPRTRNTLANNLLSENVYGGEGGYLLKSPRIKARAVFFFTRFMNQTKTLSFYHDDVRNFVNHSFDSQFSTEVLGVDSG